MKYDQMEITSDEKGFEFVGMSVMKGKIEKPCMTCKEPTVFIDVCSEGHICSEECMDAWYKMYNEVVNEMQEVEECQQ